MKEYKITKERLKAMAEECPQAKGILKKGFPEAFKEELPEACCDEFALALRQEGMGQKEGSWVQLMGKKDGNGERDFLWIFYCPYCQEKLGKQK